MDQENRARPTRRGGREALSRDRILETAERMVEESGASTLSMRRLADELGIAPTTIYWHVGNRDALVDGLVARFCATLSCEAPAGDTPRARLLTLARRLRVEVSARPQLLELMLAHGRISELYRPAIDVAISEFEACGLSASDVVRACRTLLIAVTGFVWSEAQLVELHARAQRRPGTSYTGIAVPEHLLSHAETLDADDLFEYAIGKLLDGILTRPTS